MGRDITSLFADTGSMGVGLFKSAQEQPDETKFAQDFSNIAFQFMQDRAPALMKYILGFEVVDRAENGTRAVGIFGFKINGDYYYVPAFFLNGQIKGVDSILSKRTNSFVPLTEDWVNTIINRKASELGGEAPSSGEAKDYENPNFDFLQQPQVGPMDAGIVAKSASASDDKPWTLSEAWGHAKSAVENGYFSDPAFKDAVVGSYVAFGGGRPPFGKKAESPVQDFIRKVGGPKADRTMMNALRNVKTANAALEFYTGPRALHVDRYPEGGKGCYLLAKEAQEAEATSIKIEITSMSSGGEDEAREILEDGFTIHDKRDGDHKSEVIEKDYEGIFQNPDRPGVYNVLVAGGKTVKAYVLFADGVFSKARRTTLVYFPDNKQAILTRNANVLAEGGPVGGLDDIMKDAIKVSSCSPNTRYMFVGPCGTAMPSFEARGISRISGERPRIEGTFSYMPLEGPDRDDDAYGSCCGSCESFWFGDIELAEFKGSPKAVGSSVLLPSDWKALEVDPPAYGYTTSDDDHESEPRATKRHRLGTLDELFLELQKQGAASLGVFSDDGYDFYLQFNGGGYTRPAGYKQACVDLVTRLGLGPKDAKRLLKKAAVERSARCLIKMGQFVGVSPYQPKDQAAGSDPYTGIPTYQTPFYDVSTMPFEGVDPSVGQDNEVGENIGGEFSRNVGQGGGGEAEFDPEAAQLAQDAGRLGQKDVFDKAAIGGLAKVYDTGAVIDSYLPEFMQAVDRVGRVLFLYYWKHDDFVERYGTDPVIEMEDSLRNVFRNLGKLTLDLMKKAVGDVDNPDADIV